MGLVSFEQTFSYNGQDTSMWRASYFSANKARRLTDFYSCPWFNIYYHRLDRPQIHRPLPSKSIVQLSTVTIVQTQYLGLSTRHVFQCYRHTFYLLYFNSSRVLLRPVWIFCLTAVKSFSFPRVRSIGWMGSFGSRIGLLWSVHAFLSDIGSVAASQQDVIGIQCRHRGRLSQNMARLLCGPDDTWIPRTVSRAPSFKLAAATQRRVGLQESGLEIS